MFGNSLFSKTSQSYAATKINTGFRSKLEVAVNDQLISQGLKLGQDYEYETITLNYTKPCSYRPDFILKKQAIIIESKGLFDSEDRRKMILVKQQHPDLDIRFIFSNPNKRIGSKSTTMYGAWASKHGFPYAKVVIPQEWLNHKPTKKQKEALSAFYKSHG